MGWFSKIYLCLPIYMSHIKSTCIFIIPCSIRFSFCLAINICTMQEMKPSQIICDFSEYFAILLVTLADVVDSSSCHFIKKCLDVSLSNHSYSICRLTAPPILAALPYQFPHYFLFSVWLFRVALKRQATAASPLFSLRVFTPNKQPQSMLESGKMLHLLFLKNNNWLTVYVNNVWRAWWCFASLLRFSIVLVYAMAPASASLCRTLFVVVRCSISEY